MIENHMALGDFEEFEEGIEEEQDPDMAYEMMRDRELHEQMDALERELEKALKGIGAGLDRSPWK